MLDPDSRSKPKAQNKYPGAALDPEFESPVASISSRICAGKGLVRVEMPAKPLRRQARHLLQRSWLLEQMRGARYDRQFLRAGKLDIGMFVQAQDRFVTFSDDQQCRRIDTRQGVACQIGPSPA